MNNITATTVGNHTSFDKRTRVGNTYLPRQYCIA